MKLMVYVLLAAVLCLSVSQGYQFDQISKSRSEAGVRSRQERIYARDRDLHTWHSVVCSIEAATVANASVPAAQKPAVVRFYDNLLVSIQARPCGLKIPKK